MQNLLQNILQKRFKFIQNGNNKTKTTMETTIKNINEALEALNAAKEKTFNAMSVEEYNNGIHDEKFALADLTVYAESLLKDIKVQMKCY